MASKTDMMDAIFDDRTYVSLVNIYGGNIRNAGYWLLVTGWMMNDKLRKGPTSGKSFQFRQELPERSDL
jgi:hypothetical protein